MKSTGDGSLRREPSSVEKSRRAPRFYGCPPALKNFIRLNRFYQPMFEAMVCSIAAALEDITR